MMKSINPIFLHNFLNGIAESIVKVFVPVLILQHMGSIEWALAYIIIFYLSNMLLGLALNKLILRYNMLALIIHILLYVLVPILIACCEFSIPLVIILGILSGFGQCLYYTPIENLYTYTNDNVNMAKFDAFCAIGYFIFSLVSAYILGSTLADSLLWVCMAATIVYICSLIPLIIKKEQRQSYKKIKINKYPKTKFYKLYIFFWVFSGAGYAVSSMVIPVYMYDISPSIELVGIVLGATFLIQIGLDYLCRWLRLRNMQVLSIAIYFILFVASVAMISIWHSDIMLVITSTLCGLSYIFSYITMQGDYLDQIKKDNCAPIGVLYKNISVLIMRMVVVALYFIIPSFLTIFIGAAVCTLITLIITILLIRTRKQESAKSLPQTETREDDSNISSSPVEETK